MPEKDDQWLGQVRRARVELWSVELARCLSCRARAIGCRFGITEETAVNGGIEGRADLGLEHEGGPGVAHGGVVAGILDEVLGHVAMSRGVLAVTRELTVELIKPTPLGTPLTLSSHADAIDGRKWTLSGTISLPSSGTVVARATGLWLAVPDTHYESHRSSMLAENHLSAE